VSGAGLGSVAGVIGARIYRSHDGRRTTDSSSMYEVLALSRHAESFTLLSLGGVGDARDPILVPDHVRLEPLGTVVSGGDLYLHPVRIFRRLSGSARSGEWSRAAIFETGLVALVALAACRAARKPAIAVVRGDAASTASTAERYSRGWKRAMGRGLGLLHLISQRIAAGTVPVVVDHPAVLERIRRWGGEVTMVPAGSFVASEVKPKRSTWKGSGSGPLRLLWVGRVENVKGLPVLLEAVSRLRSGGRAVHLELVGGGDPDVMESLRAMVSRLSLQGAVELTGPVPHGPELFARYRGSDVFVIPSLSEGMPKVVPEALAHGLPVVGTCVGSLPQLIDERIGMVVAPGDPDALADAILQLFEDPERLAKMSRVARERGADFSADRLSAELASVLATARVPRWRR
jgi:glycosyl transferase family 1